MTARRVKGEHIEPPGEVFVVVKVRRCKDHEKQSVQAVNMDRRCAELFAEHMSPFGSCNVCTYEAMRYVLAGEHGETGR